MDPVSVGFFSLVPPLISLILALKTRDVFSSLIVGVFSGTMIYAFSTDGNPLIRTFEVAVDVLVSSVNLKIALFCLLLGALVSVIEAAGGLRAYGTWVRDRISSRRKAQLSTSLLGILIFIDDYFNCLTVGTVMRPITDRFRISREKLAFLVDSTAAPICILVPISSWAVAVSSNISSDSGYSVYLQCIPWNLYAIFCLIFLFAVVLLQFDFGPMRHAEKVAQQPDLQFTGVDRDDEETDSASAPKSTLADMLVPIFVLTAVTMISMLYTGGYWGGDPKFHDIATAIGNTEADRSLIFGCFAGLAVAYLMFIPRKLLKISEFSQSAVKGAQMMFPAVVILTLAWTISAVTHDLLDAPHYIAGLLDGGSSFVVPLLPALIFVLAGTLSFCTGTAWGTFGILIPVVSSTLAAISLDNSAFMNIAIAATLSGSVFGDHCSPISDTTILSSAGSRCELISHVVTQMPYSIFVAVCALAGFLVAGYTQSLALSFAASAGVMICGILAIKRIIGYRYRKDPGI